MGIMFGMLVLGRTLVWTYVVVFLATVSCALACLKTEPAERTYQACQESRSDRGCCQSAENRCFICVDTNFLQPSNTLASGFTNLTLDQDALADSIETNRTKLLHSSPRVRILPPGELIFLKNSVFRI